MVLLAPTTTSTTRTITPDNDDQHFGHSFLAMMSFGPLRYHYEVAMSSGLLQQHYEVFRFEGLVIRWGSNAIISGSLWRCTLKAWPAGTTYVLPEVNLALVLSPIQWSETRHSSFVMRKLCPNCANKEFNNPCLYSSFRMSVDDYHANSRTSTNSPSTMYKHSYLQLLPAVLTLQQTSPCDGV